MKVPPGGRPAEKRPVWFCFRCHYEWFLNRDSDPEKPKLCPNCNHFTTLPKEEVDDIIKNSVKEILTTPLGATPKLDIWRSILANVLGPKMGDRRYPLREVFALETTIEEALIQQGVCQRGPFGGMMLTEKTKEARSKN